MSKIRKTVNVSIQKRNFDKINEILNSWEDDGCNISNKICEAILFKEASQENPHILTILSTLNLIESSLKAKCNLSQEEISLNATEIFKQVLTLNIDGEKLTSFLTGSSNLIRINNDNVPANNIDNSLRSDNTKSIQNNYIETNNDTTNATTNNTNNNNKSNSKDSTEYTQENPSDNETCLSAIVNSPEVQSIKSSINNAKALKEAPSAKNDKSNMIVWTNFPDDKNLSKKTSENSNNNSDKKLNDILGGFICHN